MAEQGKPAPQKIGKYEIVSTLGKGAMGVVYRARDPFIGREVALKTMLKELVEGEEEQQRFFREAQAAGNLKHNNIVTIYELGMDADTAFIAMELLEGKDLKKLMRDQPDLPADQKLEIVAEILDGLDYAHKRGIVHRDIKPANIHIGDDGSVKIMDFGIARVSTSEMTKTGMVLGTVSYMSPEQVAGQKVDGRSDIFAVGVILYELMTKQKPFPGDTISTIIHRIISKDPEPFDTTGLPPGMEHAINRALAKNVEDRYTSAEEMAADLRAIVQGTGPLPVATGSRPAASTDDATVKGAPTTSRAASSGVGAATGRTVAAGTSRTVTAAAGRTVAASAPAFGAPEVAEAPRRSSAGPIIAIVGIAVVFLFVVAGGAAIYFVGPKLLGKTTPTATATPPPTTSPDPSPTVEATPTGTPEATPEPTPTAVETPTPELTPIATPTPEPTPSPTLVAVVTPSTPPVETPKPPKTRTPEEPVDEDYEPTDDERAQAGAIADEGRDLLYENKLQAAEAKLLRARRLDPAAPNTYLYLVLCYRKMGKNAKAQQTLEQARRNVPNWDGNPYVQQLLGGGGATW